MLSFNGLELQWMWALWGVRLWFCLEFLVVSCCSTELWARGLRWPCVWLRKSRHSHPGCVTSLHSASVLMSDAHLFLPSRLPRGRRSSCGPGVCLCVPLVPCLPVTPTSYQLDTRFAPTSQILLAMHNLNTLFFCIVHYTRCRFYWHESSLFCLCVSTAVLGYSGLFPYLLSTLPPPLHTLFFLKHILRGSFHLQYFSHRKGL